MDALELSVKDVAVLLNAVATLVFKGDIALVALCDVGLGATELVEVHGEASPRGHVVLGVNLELLNAFM
jgi:hypothetical protein